MKQNKKVECYQQTYEFLSAYPEMVDLKRPEHQDNLELLGRIGDIRFLYCLSLKGDSLMLKAEFPCPDKTINEMLMFGEKLKGDRIWISNNAFDGALVFHVRHLFHGENEESAYQQLLDKTKEFVEMLINNQDEIQHLVDNDNPYKNDIAEEEILPEEEDTRAVEDSVLKKDMDSEENMEVAESEPKEETNENHVPEEEKPDVPNEFDQEKKEFFQYCKDQTLLIDSEKNKLHKKEKQLKKWEKNLEQKKKNQQDTEARLAAEKEELDILWKNYQKEKGLFDSAKQEFETKVQKFQEESLEESMLKRRSEYEKMEASFFEKKEEFQRFEEETLRHLKNRLDDLEAKEKSLDSDRSELLELQQQVDQKEKEIRKQKEEIDCDRKKLKTLEMKLSDQVAEVKRAAILKKEAENLQARIEIEKGNLEKEKGKLRDFKANLSLKEKEIDKEKNTAILLNDMVLKQKESIQKFMEESKKTAKEKENLTEQLEAIKKDLDSILPKYDKSMKNEAYLKEELGKMKSLLEDNVNENSALKEQVQSLLEEKSALKDSLNIAVEDKEETDLILARVRGELYELKEYSKDSSGSQNLVEDFSMERNVLEEKIMELQDENNQIHKDNDALIKQLAESHNIMNVQTEWELKDDMVLDIPFTEVIGEKEGIYYGSHMSFSIYIDLSSKMLQIEKPVKHANKIYKKLEDMNGRDLSTTFFTKPKMVIGRKYGGDSLEEALTSLISQMDKI